MISIQQLSKQYCQEGAPVSALQDVSLQVPRGAICGVVGPSGAGKSTLIRCVNLLEVPDRGRVVIDGAELTALPPAQLRVARRKTGMIFQHFNLLHARTVAQNVEFPLEINGTPCRTPGARGRVVGLGGAERQGQCLPGPTFRRAEATRGDCARPGLPAAGIALG